MGKEGEKERHDPVRLADESGFRHIDRVLRERAIDTFQQAMHEHPSFADRFWQEELEKPLHGEASDVRILQLYRAMIDRAIFAYARRDRLVDVSRRLCRDFEEERTPKEQEALRVVRTFLDDALHNKTLTLDDIRVELLVLLRDHSLAGLREGLRETLAAILAPHPGGSVGLAGAELHKDRARGTENASASMRVYQAWLDARRAADQFARTFRGRSRHDLQEELGELTETFDALCVEMADMYGIPSATLRAVPPDVMQLRRIVAGKAEGSTLSHLEHDLSTLFGLWFRGERMAFAIELHSGDVARQQARARLGLEGGGDEAEIERAFLARIAGADDRVREQLMRDRDFLLFDLLATQSRQPQSAFDDDEQAGMLSVVTPPKGERTTAAPESTNAHRILAVLFGAAAVAAVGAIALQEFVDDGNDDATVKRADVHADNQAASADAPEKAGEVTEEEFLFGLEDTSSWEGNAALLGATEAHDRLERALDDVRTSSETFIMKDKDTIWAEVVQMLRARGLSSSNAMTQYFTHKVLVDNGLDTLAATKLMPGTVIDVSRVRDEMDAMVAGVPYEAAPDVAVSHAEDHQADGSPTAEQTIDGPDGGVVLNAPRVDIFQPEAVMGKKAYQELPADGHTEHVIRRGEILTFMLHRMLRARKLNWTHERINFLTQLVVDENADRFRQLVAEGKMKYMHDDMIPVGAVVDFARAIDVLDDMEAAKKAGQKAKTVKELAEEHGYSYPIMMAFPK